MKTEKKHILKLKEHINYNECFLSTLQGELGARLAGLEGKAFARLHGR